jgi:hypothetical protein
MINSWLTDDDDDDDDDDDVLVELLKIIQAVYKSGVGCDFLCVCWMSSIDVQQTK